MEVLVEVYMFSFKARFSRNKSIPNPGAQWLISHVDWKIDKDFPIIVSYTHLPIELYTTIWSLAMIFHINNPGNNYIISYFLPNLSKISIECNLIRSRQNSVASFYEVIPFICTSLWFVHMQHKSWSLTSIVNILGSLYTSFLLLGFRTDMYLYVFLEIELEHFSTNSP